MGYETSLDAARAELAKAEADLALERAKCECNSDQRRCLERDVRSARETLRIKEENALAKLETVSR